MADNKNLDHPLWTTLTQVLQLETAPSLHEPEIAGNDQTSFARDKIFAFAHVIRSLMESTPATLVSLHALGQLNTHVQAALNELNAYVSNKNVAHISNAATQFEQNVLPWLWGFVPCTQATENDALPRILEGLSRSASETTKQLVQDRDNLASNIQEANATAAELKSRLDDMAESAARERAEA